MGNERDRRYVRDVVWNSLVAAWIRELFLSRDGILRMLFPAAATRNPLVVRCPTLGASAQAGLKRWAKLELELSEDLVSPSNQGKLVPARRPAHLSDSQPKKKRTREMKLALSDS
ncbi:unnamed protein product [Rhizoctonia solani]|uniref:Uncharacterized protein n=1 Tax=Rhizoctonia solani TaxID=456999 RepID=A0A8H3D8B0_9AGAM|nr:unnamed protein product [Rhizoctonia solani]